MRPFLLILSCVLIHACAGDPPAIDPANFPRARDGKADELIDFDPSLSCTGLCDAPNPIAAICGVNECSPSDGYCFCDAACVETGDCCDDYASECTSGPGALCDATGGVFEDGECACVQDGASADYVFTFLGCMAPEQLCDQTGGVFEDGECACVQDGASANHVFSLPAGCVDRASLCEDSGGVFEGGECDCFQDAASAHLSFFPLQGGCALPETSSIEALFGLDAMLGASAIDADVGIYMIVGDAVLRFESVAEALQASPQVDLTLMNGFCDVVMGEAEQCTNIEASQCFLARSDEDYLSAPMMRENMAGFESHLEDDIDAALQLEGRLTYQVSVVANGLDLHFAYSDGAYTLVAIEFTECS